MPTTTFDVEVVTEHTPQEFVERLFERVKIKTDIEVVDDAANITTKNFEITAFDHAQDALSRELGIEPNVFIEFRPKPTLQTDLLAIKYLLEAMNEWLHAIDNDFCMVHNGESVMMYRKDCQLYINVASNGWTANRLTLITHPFQTVEMPPLTKAADGD